MLFQRLRHLLASVICVGMFPAFANALMLNSLSFKSVLEASFESR